MEWGVLAWTTASAAGAFLLALAMLLFLMEFALPTHGAVAAAGVVATSLAVVLLLQDPVVPPGAAREILIVAVVVTVLMGGGTIAAVVYALKPRHDKAWDSILGAHGRATEAIDPEGIVELHGEMWSARTADAPIPAGARVEILARRGLILSVTSSDEDE